MSWDEEVGGRLGSAWDGTLESPCPGCGVDAGVKCVQKDGKPRHMPCLVRFGMVSA